jgi:cytochrome c551/c552
MKTIALIFVFAVAAAAQQDPAAFVNQYCLGCHSSQMHTAGLDLQSVDAANPAADAEVWEKVVRRLRARQMPPADIPRPDEATYAAVVAKLSASLDAAAKAKPNPGRTDTFRRLNRTEYHNAVRDLLAIEVDVANLLPSDESSHGFDNITVADLSPTLLDRYISAAEKISRLAVGRQGNSPDGYTVRMPPDLTQEEHVAGLPVGTRGGALVPYTFPLDAEYEVTIRLTRDRNENVEGLTEPHEVEVLLDRERLELFTINPAKEEGEDALVDQHLKLRIPVTAGPHELGVTFIKKPSQLIETERQPYQARFNFYRHPRTTPALFSVSITGPYDAKGPGESPSRQRLFTCTPADRSEEDACAKEILTTLTRRAYRRSGTEKDLARPMEFFRQARSAEGFDAGIEMALSAVLVSPEFLFRVERDPAGVAPQTAYRLSDVELASRLSFFLWSSIPDDELLDAAIAGKLHEPAVLESHARRMLADKRSETLVTNFASQWLYLRNLDSILPDMRLYPDFDDNLRQAFRRETELFFESILREDRSVLDLLRSDYTFLNERLAKHYGIANIYGSRFRRIDLEPGVMRGGLLRHGSVLTVSSYPTRTSPVIRGKWVLENILGVPPPAPPPNVPALEETQIAANLSVRDRLAKHRENPVCYSCHRLTDPVGFALENYDAVGRWRTLDGEAPVDASGGLPDGSEFEGIEGIEDAILARPEIFAGVVAEKLMTYGLGRGVESYDAPAVREVVLEAKADDFRLSALIIGITKSVPFQMRRSR